MLKSRAIHILIAVAALAIIVVSGHFISNAIYLDSNIWVNGIDSTTVGSGFSYDIANKCRMKTGGVYEFSIFQSQDRFFSDLKKSYKVFYENDTSIQLIWHNQIFSIKNYGKHYKLFGEYFVIWQDGEGHAFPFPTERMKLDDEVIPILESPRFQTIDDLHYLHRFYEVYGSSVTVDGNVIKYKNLILELDPDGWAKVSIEK